MKRLITSLLLILTLSFSAGLFTQPALAWSPFGAGVGCGKVSSVNGSAVCKDSKSTADPVTGNNGILMKIINLLAIVAGVAAIIMIVLAGLRFITSGGGSEDVAGARRTIIYASVGLIVIVLGRTLIAFVLSKL